MSDPGGAFEAYGAQVYGWAYRLVGRHHDAMDICQDVFLRWWRQAREGDRPHDPRPWLRRVTINRAIDVLRQRTAALQLHRAAPGASAAASEMAQQDELRADVAEVLRSLTDAQRSVLVAKLYDGLTFAQIAREQAIAVPTAKTHYLRALTAMRDRLQRRWGRPDPPAPSGAPLDRTSTGESHDA